MKVNLRKKSSLVILALVLIIVGLLTIPFLLIQDQSLTDKVTAALQKTLAKNNLKIEVQKIHLNSWNRITCTQLKLIDTVDNTVPLESSRVDLIVDPFSLVLNRDHPEAAVGKVKLYRPIIMLSRAKNGKWNFTHFFSSSKRELQLNLFITVEKGWFKLKDYQYGKYNLENISGNLDMLQFPVINWNFKGQADFCSTLRWASQGSLDFNKLVGTGSITAKQLNLKTLSKMAGSFLPASFPVVINSGAGNFQLNFAWNNKHFWVEKGQAEVSNTKVYFPQLDEMNGLSNFQIKSLQAEFNPDKFILTKAYLSQGETTLRVHGEVNLKNSDIKASIDAGRVNLADLMKFVPDVKDIAVEGMAAVKLNINGPLSGPVLNGKVSLNNGQVVYQEKESVKRIAGEINISKNNLKITHLGGIWRDSLFQVSGTVTNLFKPSLDLTVSGQGLNLTKMGLTGLLKDSGLEIGNNADITGQITGEILNPKLSCRIALNHLGYQNIPVSNLRADLILDRYSAQSGVSLQILALDGDVWKGHFTSKGEVNVGADSANWRIKGNLSDLDLEKTGLEIKGLVSTDLILKGSWERGKPFDVGNVLGTFGAKKLDFGMAYLDATEGVFSFHDGFLNVDSLQAVIGDGRVFGSLLYGKNSLNANINAENINFHDLFPNYKQYSFDGVLKGDISFQGPLDNMTGKVSGVISNAYWHSKLIGEIRGDISYKDKNFNIEGLQVVSDVGNLTVEGQVAWEKDPVLKLNVASERMEVKKVLDRLGVVPPFKINGMGTVNLGVNGTLSTPVFHGEINLKDPSFENITMTQGKIQFDGNFNEIKIAKCQFTKNSSSIDLLGTINKEKMNLKITGHSFALNIFGLRYGGNELNGKVDLEGNISGNLSAPIIQADITGSNLSFGTLFYQKMNARVFWDQNGLEIKNSSFSQNDSSLNVYGNITLSKPVILDLNAKVRDFNIATLKQAFKIPDNIAMGGKISGALKINGSLDHPSVQANGEIQDGSFDNLPAKGDFALLYTTNRISLQRLQLDYGSGSLLAEGSWESDRSVKAQIHLTDFPIDITRLFLQPSIQLTGKATSNINLQWSKLGILGDYGVDVSELNFNQRNMGNLHLKGKFSELGLSVEDSHLTGKSGIADVDGFIPWPDKLAKELNLPLDTIQSPREVALNVTLKNMAGDLINKYFSQFSVLNGIVNGQLQVGGGLKAPKISGTMDCNNVKLNVYSLPIPIDDLQMSVSIDNNVAYIQKARGLYGKGKFTATGDCEFDGFKEFNFSLAMVGSRLYYKNLYFDGYSDASVKVTGTVDSTFTVKDSLVSGDATVYDCKVGILGVPMGPPYIPIWDPRFNLTVKAGSNVRCNIIGLADLNINKGLLQVTGRYSGVVLDGEIDSNTGLIIFYGQNFRINQGKALFRSSKGFKPYLEIDSSQMKAQTEVFLSIRGPLDEFNTILSSEPYMPPSELYAFLNWSDLRGDQPLSPTKVLSGNIGALTDIILGDVFYELRKSLDIDYLYLEPDFLGNAVNINVGKYLNDYTFLSYSRTVAHIPNETWALNFKLSTRLSLGWSYTQLDGSSWRLVYRGHF